MLVPVGEVEVLPSRVMVPPAGTAGGTLIRAMGWAYSSKVAPFSMRGYDSFTLGDATQQSLRDIWNGPRYQQFRGALLSDDPPPACASCGLRWSL